MIAKLRKNSQTSENAQLQDSGKYTPILTAPARKLDKPCQSYRKKRRGAAAVEFAVVAPIFLLLVFGMIEYGRMVMVQQVLTNASREGARCAVLDGATHQRRGGHESRIT